MDRNSVPGPIEAPVHRATAETAPWIEGSARVGYAAKGVVYVAVGLLAVQAAFGGRSAEGSEGALRALLEQPFGQSLLALTGIGLICFVLWRFVQAAANPENAGAGKRAFYVVSGIVYAGLALEAWRLLRGGGSGQGSDAAADAMSRPGGAWLLIAFGIAIALYGVQQVWRGWSADLRDRLDLSTVPDGVRPWIRRLGRFGMAARGVVLALLGSFLVVSGWQHEPGEARGIGGVLATIQAQPYGEGVLAVIGAGLVAYGVHSFVSARYRRIRPA